MCLNAFNCYRYNMAKRKNSSTPSPSKKSKKAKTSVKPKELIEKDFKVRVKLPTSPTADKGKSDKSPKTPSTSTVDKGKKVKANSLTTVMKKKQDIVISAKIPLQKGNHLFW